MLCLPFAGVISPLLGLCCLVRTTRLLSRAAGGDQRALSKASSGSVGRTLHISAGNACDACDVCNVRKHRYITVTSPLHHRYIIVTSPPAWNAASLLNAFVALVAFATASPSSWLTPQAWLMPLGLFCTKLLVAQAHKLLAASSSMTGGVFGTLLALGQSPPPTKPLANADPR